MTALQFPADDCQPLSEINTTPLIDVMLVLLIMLILTMPAATHRTNMEFGRGGQPREAVDIEIDFDGSLYWNGNAVESMDTLESYFRSTAKRAVQPDLRINVNRHARYDVVAKVIAAAQRNGMQRIGFAGQERFGDE